MSKEQKQREKSFIKQSFFQGSSIFAGQVTYYITAPLVSNWKVLLFLDASLWAFMHAFEGINCVGVRVDVLDSAET
uniref:7TM_GPCR_Srx domain-containing protein n=1 Tax=Caenorhabditis tropicalis TaxID=1561998 RepID=A0A1I7V275_9PELO